MTVQLDARAYLDLLVTRGDLGTDRWPEQLVMTLGHPIAARRRHTTATPFGRLLDHDGSAVLQSSVVGGSAMAVVAQCLAVLGVEEMVVVGRGGALGDELPDAGVVTVSSVMCDDGVSRRYGASGAIPMSDDLTRRISEGPSVRAVTTDVPFLLDDRRYDELRRRDVSVVEMELAAARAATPSTELGALVVVSDRRTLGRWRPSDQDAVRRGLDAATARAQAALGASS